MEIGRTIARIRHRCRPMLKYEAGSQVVEYALIIAVVSIALVVALQALNGAAFTGFIARVNACLTTAVCV